MKTILITVLLIATASASAQTVSLSVSPKGYMTLNWSVVKPGSYDFVALYDGDPYQKGTHGYLTNQWQWASRTSPHVTGTTDGFYYYIAYIEVAGRNKKRRIRAIAGGTFWCRCLTWLLLKH